VSAAITGHDNVPVLEPNASVAARTEIRVTLVTGEPGELARQSETVALGDAARPADISASPVVVTVSRGFLGESTEAFDPLACDRLGVHPVSDTSRRVAGILCVRVRSTLETGAGCLVGQPR
jgi:hypothetical protein